MESKTSKKIAEIWGRATNFDAYFIVGSLSFLYFLGLARLDPDPHHDGVQFAAAAGVAQGLNLHSQVYEQYGPVTAWLQGGTLKVFGATLLNLRLENVLLLTIASLLLLKILLILRIPNLAAILICLLWALSCPASSIYPGAFGLWPWSSVLALVLLLTNTAILLRSRVGRKLLSSREILFLAFVSSTIVFTRFQVGLVALFTCGILVFVNDRIRRSGDRFFGFRKFLVGLIFSTLCYLAILFYTNSLTSFVDQIIVGPQKQYLYSFNWAFFRIYYLLAPIPTILLLFIGAIGWRRLAGNGRILIIGLVAIVIAGLSYFGNWRNSPQLNRTDTIRALWDVQSISFLFTSVLVSLILAFFALTYILSNDFLHPVLAKYDYLGITFRKVKISSGLNSPAQRARRDEIAILGSLILLLAPFLVQFYPLADVYHLWWAAPLFMVLIPYSLMNFVSREGVNAMMGALIIPALLASSVMYLNLHQVGRTQISEGALKGMQVDSRYLPSYQNVAKLLQPLEPNSNRFFCRDGLLSSWNGSYLSIDAAYVDWAWVVKNPPTKKVPTRTFLCGTQETAENYAKAIGGHLVGLGIGYQLSYWSGGGLFEIAKD